MIISSLVLQTCTVHSAAIGSHDVVKRCHFFSFSVNSLIDWSSGTICAFNLSIRCHVRLLNFSLFVPGKKTAATCGPVIHAGSGSAIPRLSGSERFITLNILVLSWGYAGFVCQELGLFRIVYLLLLGLAHSQLVVPVIWGKFGRGPIIRHL